jgi:hypothetical protein
VTYENHEQKETIVDRKESEPCTQTLSNFARFLRATLEKIYNAFLDPNAMFKWLPPNGFTAKIGKMDAKVDGTYEMSFTNLTTGKSRRFQIKASLASPLNHRAGPGKAAAEHDHQDVIAALDSPGAVRLVERNRYSGSRRVAVAIEIHEHFVA